MALLQRSQLLRGAAAALIVRPAAVRAQALEKIQVAGVPTDDMTPIYYAIKSGMYQKAATVTGSRV